MTEFIFILVIGIYFAFSYSMGFIPLILPIVFTLSSILTFVIYAKDKFAARNGTWRTPEGTLHLLSLFFGWPGALVAQKVFRHKTKKVSFQLTFWVTLVVNVAIVAWLHTQEGARILHALMWKLGNLIVSILGQSDFSEMLIYCLQYNAVT